MRLNQTGLLTALLLGAAVTVGAWMLLSRGTDPDSGSGASDGGEAGTTPLPTPLAGRPTDGPPRTRPTDPQHGETQRFAVYLESILRERPTAWRTKLDWLRESLARAPRGASGALAWYSAEHEAASTAARELVEEMLTDHFARALKTPEERAEGARVLVVWMSEASNADPRLLAKGLHWLSLIPQRMSEAEAREVEHRVVTASRVARPRSILLLAHLARAGLAREATVQAFHEVVRDQSDAELRGDAPYWGDADTVEFLVSNPSLLRSSTLGRIEAFSESSFVLAELLRSCYASPPAITRAVGILLTKPDGVRSLTDADWSRGFVHFVRAARGDSIPYLPELLDNMRGTRDDVASVFEESLRQISTAELRRRLLSGEVIWSSQAGRLTPR